MAEQLSTTDVLLAGPRGRRLLLAFALEAERVQGLDHDNDALRYAVTLAAYHLESAREGGQVSFGSGADDADRTVVTPEDVAHRLSTVPLHDVTPTGLRSALSDAVDSARYWQDPDGEDVLATTEPVRRELRRVAEHIARSPHTRWWTAGPAGTEQWALWTWGDDRPDLPAPPASTAAERLRLWREETVEVEGRAAREYPADLSANFSAEWWSTPWARSSTRQLPDGTPAELWFVEDSMGWERAVTRRVSIPSGARVYEVDSAKAWAELCGRFPVEVTAQKRHDWYQTTGRSGRWVVPDWTQVAEEYAGVHLTVAGYLAAAGTAIDVDADTASVIAGWTPDVTYWLTDTVDANGEFRTWLCDTTGRHLDWTDESRDSQ